MKKYWKISLLLVFLLLAGVTNQRALAALTLGSTSVASDGNLTLDGGATSTYLFGNSVTSGTITIGGTATDGTITLGQSNATNTINIGNSNNAGTQSINIGADESSTGTSVIRLGSTQVSAFTTIYGGPGAGAISLSPANAGSIVIGTATQTGTIELGKSTATNSIAIGNANTITGATQTISIGGGTPAGTGKAVITIGNGNGAGSLALNSGTGDITLTSTDQVVVSAPGGFNVTSSSATNVIYGTTIFLGNVYGRTPHVTFGTGGGSPTTTDSGATFQVNMSSSNSITLPSLGSLDYGIHYRFLVTTGGTGNVTITTSGDDTLFGRIIDDSGVSTVSGTNVRFVASTATIGDYIDVVSKDGDLWHVSAVSDATGGITSF